MKRVIIVLLLLLTLVGIRNILVQQHTKTVLRVPSVQPTVQTLPLQEQIVSTPQRLFIPRIHVDAFVESVGMDKAGNMDVPKTDMHVAWYNLGYKPGEAGNMVIAGHYDTAKGEPAVFWKLDSLQKGDEIIIQGDGGLRYTYRVTAIETYPWDTFPLEKIFGSYTKNRLNLITCDGEYSTQERIYSHRTVVFSELVTY